MVFIPKPSMASSLHRENAQQREKLLKKLSVRMLEWKVSREFLVLDAEFWELSDVNVPQQAPGNPTEITLKNIKSKLEFHRFLDTHPKDTEALFKR